MANKTFLKRNNVISTTTRLSDIDRIIDTAPYHDDWDITIAEQTSDHQIMLSDPIIIIPEINIIAAPMCCFEWNESDRTFEPDWCGTAILKNMDGQLELSHYEQDPILVTLINYTHADTNTIYSARCIIAKGIPELIRPFIYDYDASNLSEIESYV